MKPTSKVNPAKKSEGFSLCILRAFLVKKRKKVNHEDRKGTKDSQLFYFKQGKVFKTFF